MVLQNSLQHYTDQPSIAIPALVSISFNVPFLWAVIVSAIIQNIRQRHNSLMKVLQNICKQINQGQFSDSRLPLTITTTNVFTTDKNLRHCPPACDFQKSTLDSIPIFKIIKFNNFRRNFKSIKQRLYFHAERTIRFWIHHNRVFCIFWLHHRYHIRSCLHRQPSCPSIDSYTILGLSIPQFFFATHRKGEIKLESVSFIKTLPFWRDRTTSSNVKISIQQFLPRKSFRQICQTQDAIFDATQCITANSSHKKKVEQIYIVTPGEERNPDTSVSPFPKETDRIQGASMVFTKRPHRRTGTLNTTGRAMIDMMFMFYCILS